MHGTPVSSDEHRTSPPAGGRGRRRPVVLLGFVLIVTLLMVGAAAAEVAAASPSGVGSQGAAPQGVSVDFAPAPSVLPTSDPLAVVATVQVPTGNFSGATAYDTRTGDLWFTTSTSYGVIPPSGDGFSALRFLGATASPTGIAFDPRTADMYIADQNLNLVYIHSDADPSSNLFVAFVHVGVSPQGVAFDSGKSEIFVANQGSSNVTVIKDSANLSGNFTSVANITVQAGPDAIVYDPAHGEVFVTDSGTGNVSVINDTTNTVVATIPVGSDPDGLVYDPVLDEMFVANLVSSNLSIIVGTATHASASVSVSFPRGLTYDPRTGDVFAASENDLVAVVGDRNATAFATVGGINGPNHPTFDPANGAVYVNEFPYAFAIIAPAESVSLTERGLVAGSAWTVAVFGTTNFGTVDLSLRLVNTTDTLFEAAGSFQFTVATIYSYQATPTTGAFTVANAPIALTIAFDPLYAVSFTEAGLPTGDTWSVEFQGNTTTSSGTTFARAAINGTYAFTVTGPSGFAAVPANGTVSVAGAAAAVSVAFQAATAVTFATSGLPVGTAWSVTFGGASEQGTSGTLVFLVPNGVYAFSIGGSAGYSASPSSGSLTVAGVPMREVIDFSATTFSVTFEVGGLPAGQSWTVSLNGVNLSAATRLVFHESNGSYAYLVTPPTGYTASPPSGTAYVAGGPSVVLIELLPTPSPSAAVQVSPSGFDTELTIAVGIAAGALGLAAGALVAGSRARRASPPPAQPYDETPKPPPTGAR